MSIKKLKEINQNKIKNLSGFWRNLLINGKQLHYFWKKKYIMCYFEYKI